MPSCGGPAHDETADDILTTWYENYYSTTAATADGSFFERYLHTSMEAPFGKKVRFPKVLEVGGNCGEHIKYVTHQYDEYWLTDLRLPRPSEALLSDPRLRLDACDVEALPYADESFDRVVATCLLHHLTDPLAALREMRRVAVSGGMVTILLPTDPGMIYRAGKAMTSGRAAIRQGIAELYRIVNAVDHRNHFSSLLDQTKYVFRYDDVSIEWRPWRIPGWNLNAFAVVHARARLPRSRAVVP